MDWDERARALTRLPFGRLRAAWDAIDEGGADSEAMRELVLRDRYYLLIRVLHRTDLWHPWLYARCREVEAAPDGRIDLWAREHGKTSIITFAGSIQEVLRDPEITIGIFAHVKPVAKAFLAQIQRELEGNETLRGLFPDVLFDNPAKDAPAWSLDAGLVVRRRSNPPVGTLEAHGLVDGQPTGKHFKLLLYDDVVTRESVYTPEQITKTTEAWELSDNLGVAGGRKWIIGTRYHFADSYAAIMERGAARPRVHPATDDGTKSGHPVLFSVQEWERKLRDQGEATIACQQLLNPLAGAVRVFDVNDLLEYDVLPDALMVYIMVDPARSKKRDSANTAMVVLGIDEQSRKYLLDGFDHQMDLMERWQNMRDLWVKWRRAPGVQGIRVGYEVFGAQADLDYFLERQRVETDCQFTIELLEWPNDGPGSKDDRIQRLLPDVRSHALLGPYPTDDDNVTDYQVRMLAAGYEHRIAEKIVREDHEGKPYDLWARLKLQVSQYPFIDRKDLIDAVSRIYDMDPRGPEFIDSTILEPEVT